ncbi:MAG: hypothetical protein QXY45_04245 [Candidatus Aenigmatarchaeota archaeon]
MAEKKWSDYWKKYKNPVEKYEFSKIKPQKPKIEISPKIPVPKQFSPKTSGGNNKAIITVILALAILGLGYWQFRSARIIDVLQKENTDIECKLENCTQELLKVNSSLSSCESNLNLCDLDLTKKINELNSCVLEKGSINSDYKNCKNELLQAQRDYKNAKDDYDECLGSLKSKSNDLSSCSSNYNSLKSNYQNLCQTNCNGTCVFDSTSQRFLCQTATTPSTTTTTTT